MLPRGVPVQQGVVPEPVAIGQYVQGDLVAVLADGGPADAAVGDEVEVLRGSTAFHQRLAGAEVALDAPIGEGSEHLHVVEAAQQGQFTELTGDHPDVGAVLDELHAPVADGVGQATVHPVDPAFGLYPGEHSQQPAGGDLLHLRGGLGGGGEVAGGCRAEAGLLGRLRSRFLTRVNSHRASSPCSGR